MAMFENLSDRLSASLKKISGKASLTQDNIQETLREVRMALLEADVALPVVKTFVEGVKERALGQQVGSSLNPGQQFLCSQAGSLSQGARKEKSHGGECRYLPASRH